MQIHNDGLRSAANNHPLKGHFIGGINLLVRKPSGDIKKVPGVRSLVKLPSLAPANIRRAAEDVDDRVLLAMVMDSRASSRFDSEQASPNGRLDASTGMDSGEAQGPGCLSSCGIELLWRDYTNCFVLHEFSLYAGFASRAGLPEDGSRRKARRTLLAATPGQPLRRFLPDA